MIFNGLDSAVGWLAPVYIVPNSYEGSHIIKGGSRAWVVDLDCKMSTQFGCGRCCCRCAMSTNHRDGRPMNDRMLLLLLLLEHGDLENEIFFTALAAVKE